MAPPEPYPCAEDNQRKPKKKPQEHLPDPVSRAVQRTNTRLLGRQGGRAKLQMGSRGFPRPESGADRSEAPPCRSTTMPPRETPPDGSMLRMDLPLREAICPRALRLPFAQKAPTAQLSASHQAFVQRHPERRRGLETVPRPFPTDLRSPRPDRRTPGP